MRVIVNQPCSTTVSVHDHGRNQLLLASSPPAQAHHETYFVDPLSCLLPSAVLPPPYFARLFLSPYDLTPTYKDVHNKFSVRYFLNLVLVDEEDRRYFKQQEIYLYRKADDQQTAVADGHSRLA